MANPLGFRFDPTDEEIVDQYLRSKNKDGNNTSHVDEVISTVDFYKFDPWELASKYGRESGDQVWHFFCRRDKRGTRQNRKTKSGSWKKTGETPDIMRKRGNPEKIGEKRIFVFQPSSGSKPKSDWVMHEYIATFLPSTDQMMYIMCKLKFKGDTSDLPSSSSGGGGGGGGEDTHNHSLITHMNHSGGSEGLQNPSQFNGYIDVDKETQIGDAILWAFENISTPDVNCVLNYNDYFEEDHWYTMFVDEDRNGH